MILTFSIAAGILAWIGCAALNHLFYGRLFADGPAGQDRDLLVLLGPVGSLMLGLAAALAGFLKLTNLLGTRLAKANLLVLAALVAFVPWLGAGIVNHIWYGRQFPDGPAAMDRDLLVAMGPVGTIMLAATAGVGVLLNLSARLAGSRS